MSARILTVAESDSCAAAGLQADIKTIMALGGYAMTAVSAVTAQNTKGIAHLETMEPQFVAQQMRLMIEDIGVDAIKTGVLVNAAIVNAVGDVLDDYMGKNIPVVIDPSVFVRRGEKLMNEQGISALKRRLFIRASVLTPNIREAELLTGIEIRNNDHMRHAADMLRSLGAEAVLIKAGHTLGDNAKSQNAVYMVVTEKDERIYERPIIKTKRTLGAGATIASAIAVCLAQKMDVFAAVERALDYVHQAILQAPVFGTGPGPLNHAFTIDRRARIPNARKK